MPEKPSYKEIEQRVKKLEGQTVKRKQAEKSLKEINDRCHALFGHSLECIFTCDFEGNFLDANQAALDFVGYTKEEMPSVNFATLMSEDQLPLAFKGVEEVIRTGFQKDILEFKLKRRDGQYVYAEITAALLYRDGKPFAIQGIIRDITERIQAKRAIKESEEKFKSLSENSPDIICTLGTDGSLTYVNPAWEKIMGHKRQDVMGKYFVDFARREDVRGYVHRFKRIRDEKKTIRDIPGTLIHKDGCARLFTLNGGPNLNLEGKVTGIVGLLKDITEQNRLQVQLQQAQKMEAIGTLAGGVAHDLNNVLAGLVSYPELLLMEIPQDSPLRGSILTIQKAGQKAAAIVQDLLTLARRGVNVMEIADLNHIISEYLESPEYEKLELYHPGVQVKTNLSKDLLNILGSPVHLSKTVMNLVSNAAEAMPTGGKIFISTENRYIDGLIRGYHDVKEGDYIILTVSDTGVGMSQADMKRIFEPFYTKKVMGKSGTGLGMAVVCGTVKDHKGYIDIQSLEGEGTTFTLYFPGTRKESAKDESSVSIEDYTGKGESILVVDDVEEQREIASAMLKRLNYFVTSVSSGEEAIDYMKDNSADLIVLDMIMDPGIDGLETYKRILELHPVQKAIIASGYSETELVKEAQKLGAGAYIKKPYLLEKIGSAVRAELDK
ncbi:MAG: PAS domain S-box protein [Thermodesulfobacteriota bacterium]|nr:PAS domain S-box protein [Thermodesulfobacteriota bacterium]